MFNIFKSNFQPREFGYKPRFYNAEREELQNRIRARQQRGLNDSEETRLRLRQHFGNYKRGGGSAGGYGGVSARLQTGSTLRLLIIVVLLSAASYVVIENWLPELMNAWFPQENTEYELLDEYGT